MSTPRPGTRTLSHRDLCVFSIHGISFCWQATALYCYNALTKFLAAYGPLTIPGGLQYGPADKYSWRAASKPADKFLGGCKYTRTLMADWKADEGPETACARQRDPAASLCCSMKKP